ncbi:hypothetical protein [Beijerinckia mobilis]|uniref:hypothetical protein n=1 Tax=Beijerinckia mobilis TaxID=231434 RepID=UPI0012EBC198|nr:hypothetical protein [Beijerinckia mobilis]
MSIGLAGRCHQGRRFYAAAKIKTDIISIAFKHKAKPRSKRGDKTQGEATPRLHAEK